MYSFMLKKSDSVNSVTIVLGVVVQYIYTCVMFRSIHYQNDESFSNYSRIQKRPHQVLNKKVTKKEISYFLNYLLII